MYINKYSLIKGIIDDDSNYKLENVIFNNIKTSSKAILKFDNKDVFINNIEVDNISCTGDNGFSSFILFNSEYSDNTLNIANSNFRNSFSNGPFIKIVGNTNKFILENTSINNITSYGPIIENNSIKVFNFFISFFFFFFFFFKKKKNFLINLFY